MLTVCVDTAATVVNLHTVTGAGRVTAEEAPEAVSEVPAPNEAKGSVAWRASSVHTSS